MSTCAGDGELVHHACDGDGDGNKTLRLPHGVADRTRFGLRYLGFFAVVISVLGLLHWYLWRRLVKDTGLRRLRRVATAVMAALPVLMLAAAAVSVRFPTPGRRWAATVMFVWLGASFYLLLVFGAHDLIRLGRWIGRRLRRAQPVDPERRRFLARAAAGTAGAVAAVASSWGVRTAFEDAEVSEVAVRIPDLPPRVSGTTIVQLTDLHIGPALDGRFVSRLVERVHALKPDAIALTGDLVDGSVTHLRSALAPLGRLRAPLGVFAVTGNHEYYSGADEWVRELRGHGIRVLRNQHARLDGGLDLVGVDDWSARRQGFSSGYDLGAALRGRDPEVPAILLAHQPRGVERAEKNGIALQLSGHTHGGQLWPFGALVALTQPFLVGLHRVGNGHIFVSRGAGFWGPPMRVGVPPEIARIALV